VWAALWSSWSVGAGAELLRLGSIGLAPELRYSRLSRGGANGISLGLRVGSAIGKPKASSAKPAEPDRRNPGREPSTDQPHHRRGHRWHPERPNRGHRGEHCPLGDGNPYRWGGSDQNGFDCSGLIQYAYAQIGIKLPRLSREQALAGSEVPRAIGELAAGDILIFADEPGGDQPSHVGLYLGDGRSSTAPRAA